MRLMSLATIKALVLAAGAIALFLPGTTAYAGEGMILRDTGKWKVYRTPEGKTIRKYARPPEPTSTTAPALSIGAATIAAPVALSTGQADPDPADKDHVALGAFYNPVAETVIPVVAISPFGTYHIAGGYIKVDETETAMAMLFAMRDIVPDRFGVYAGLSYLYMKETVTPDCAEIEATGEGGTVFGGLSVRVIDRLYLMAGMSAGNMRLTGNSDSCGDYEEYFRDRHAISGNAGLIYYIW